ncbi:MAG: hypothetical protein ABIC91_07150 [Nanoarchaeota archaeon]|nr:hypothetical protein [Nanoarchaeota archaeon]MBU1030841.1 hypothetical protein [Nanoarchaeota archaeon]MBU1850250.1 hypothetical protein [Nanoarchaeota archaeon]
MTFDLSDMIRIFNLKQALNGGEFNTSSLESDFLKFSGNAKKNTLTVKLPKLYSIEGEEIKHVSEALKILKSKKEVPKAIDIAGDFLENDNSDAFILVSNEQLNADHLSSTRSYINPLIERVYVEGESIIKDFAIYESLVGRVECWRDNLNLKEIHLFPEQFKSGPYTLTINLDTPQETLKNFRELETTLNKGRENAKKSVLDLQFNDEIVSKGLLLRKKLGSLSRYNVPDEKTFTVETNSCVLKDEDKTSFYLYNSSTKQNILIYFGKEPFVKAYEPENLKILNGEEHQKTLVELMKEGLFKPSRQVLKERIKSLENMYQTALRSGKIKIDDQESNLKPLIERLNSIDIYFKTVVNEQSRITYASKLSPELLEFLLCPQTDDPVIHELLPMLSWNKTLREYQNTNQFIKRFEIVSPEKKTEIIKSIPSSIIFSHQQNNNVNTWLYMNHKQDCENAGVTFSIYK